MPGISYLRRDRVITLCRTESGGVAVELAAEGRTERVEILPEPGPVLESARPAEYTAESLFKPSEVAQALARWQPGVAQAGQDASILDRVCLRIEDEGLAALPLEPALAAALPHPGKLAIVRLAPAPPRAAQMRFTLPLRLLQLDQQGDFDLPETIAGVFGRSADETAPALLAKADTATAYAGWAPPPGWNSVDVVQLDRIPPYDERRLLGMAAPGDVGTLGWLFRCTDLWRTRLVVLRRGKAQDPALLRRFAHRLAAQGGPAVWLLDQDAPQQAAALQGFYAALVHDAPLDLTFTMGRGGTTTAAQSRGMLLAGFGREELLRVSAPAEGLAELARELQHPEPATRGAAAGRLWSSIALTHNTLLGTAASFKTAIEGLQSIAAGLPGLQFDMHEGDGIIPLSKAINTLRQSFRPASAAPPAAQPTPPADQGRFANLSLWKLDPAYGRGAPIPPEAARLTLGTPIVLGIQLGPRSPYTPILDATALIEEPFKWEKGDAGVWLSIGITGLDFTVAGAPLQQVWLPRQGASDLVEFIIEPRRAEASQLRICLYFGADLLQSLRLAALVATPSNLDAGGVDAGGADAGKVLAEAIGVSPDRVGKLGWLARMEYAAVADIAAPPERDVALSIFANDLGGRQVVTVRGADSYDVEAPGDTSDKADAIRNALNGIGRDIGGFYAFLGQGAIPLHSAPPAQRDAALLRLADAGWSLYSAIFSRATRDRMAPELAGDRRIIHVAHLLLEKVIPWAAVYDRPSDPYGQELGGRPLRRAVCPAGLPGQDGAFPAQTCGTDPRCPLSTEGLAAAAAAGVAVTEGTTVCARHFWGFRHRVELPPYQDEGPELAAPTAPNALVRRDVTAAGAPFKMLTGYNATLGSAPGHLAELQAMLQARKPMSPWQALTNFDDIRAALSRADIDLLYLLCHARGGSAEPDIKPPVLELQDQEPSTPSRLGADGLAAGVTLAHHPLVVLNGCNTAAFSPDSLSPFIRILVRDCEAAGVLGTEVPIPELLAGEAGRLFLDAFLGGASAGDALLGLRRNLIARGNPMGLAYTLYAVSELAIAV